jgi:hypothetical protein
MRIHDRNLTHEAWLALATLAGLIVAVVDLGLGR